MSPPSPNQVHVRSHYVKCRPVFLVVTRASGTPRRRGQRPHQDTPAYYATPGDFGASPKATWYLFYATSGVPISAEYGEAGKGFDKDVSITVIRFLDVYRRLFPRLLRFVLFLKTVGYFTATPTNGTRC